jgi:hypothetical protein
MVVERDFSRLVSGILYEFYSSIFSVTGPVQIIAIDYHKRGKLNSANGLRVIYSANFISWALLLVSSWEFAWFGVSIFRSIY